MTTNRRILQICLIFVLVQIIKTSPVNSTEHKTGRNLLFPLALPPTGLTDDEDDLFNLQSREEPDDLTSINQPIPAGSDTVPSVPITNLNDGVENGGELMETANTIVFRPLFAYRKSSSSRRRVSYSNPNRRVSVYPYYYYYYYPVIRNPGQDRFPVVT